ncbi:hypothetical protein FACS189483_04210 [Spirochaetia bacterium]|nr:hypothetical protein FACS189483_04210 [Spirochaetia bacterium]
MGAGFFVFDDAAGVWYNKGVDYYFTRSSRKHKIGKQHALYAIEHAESCTVDADGVYAWNTADDRGVPLHIMGHRAVENDNLMVVFHVIPTNLRS